MNRHCCVATAHALDHKTRNAHAQKGKTDLNKTRIFKMATMEDMSKIRISSCFMHFEGVTEQLSKVTRQRLKKFVDCRNKWAKLNCLQAEIAMDSYDKFDDEFVNSYLAENTNESFDLEWYHHMKCYKKFSDEEKIRRQQVKEENGAGTSTENIDNTVDHTCNDSHVEPAVEPRRKITRSSVKEPSKTLPQRNKHVLPECCIICGKDSSWFSRDKV